MSPLPPAPSREARYDTVAIALHWLIALALFGQIAFGFLLDDIAPRDTPARAGVINLHKSFGITLGLLIALRLGWRLAHAAPPWPVAMPQWKRTAAKLSHRALYACMVVMPLSGYIGSNFSKWGVKFYGVALPPWGIESKAIYAIFNTTHVVTAWIFTALIVLHVAAALKHALVDHDGVLRRIWPWADASAATPRVPGRR